LFGKIVVVKLFVLEDVVPRQVIGEQVEDQGCRCFMDQKCGNANVKDKWIVSLC